MKSSANPMQFKIRPYYHFGLWVFDDKSTGLIQEAFVYGADDFIEYIIANKFKDKTGISCLSLTFSVQAPEYPDYKLLRTGFMEQGTLYKVDNTNFLNYKNENSLWFCAAMNLYFPESPEVIYVQAGE